MKHGKGFAFAVSCQIGIVFPLFVAMLAPVSAQAGEVVLSDVTVTAFTSFSSQRVPETFDADSTTAPEDQLLLAARALVKDGLPFPNVPNSQNSGFASSAGTVGGLFGVGVNGFHFQNSLPPNRYLARATWAQTLTNNSAVTQVSTGAFHVPNPTISLFGVGEFFPAGADPSLDASAKVEFRITTKLTHADGSIVDTLIFDYGMHTFRDSIGGAFLAGPDGDAPAPTRFDGGDGSFGFVLPQLLQNFSFGSVAPGESMVFGFDYLATASTGFGETGVFAAIGDPFDLTTSGASFSVQVNSIPEPSIPEPDSVALMALGLASQGLIRRRIVVANAIHAYKNDLWRFG